MSDDGDLPAFSQHPDWHLLEALMPHVRMLQELAVRHNVPDIFQDNGGKLLQLALVTGLTLLKKREGNDAIDLAGKEYELKTVNIRYALNRKSKPQFTTHHHLNPIIIAKYRLVNWVFATYDGIELAAIYFMYAESLEPIFAAWEFKWHDSGGKDINNPKIPIQFVEKHGIKIYPN